tara:strand:+ start:539 stop:1087 length:549 start_codon:yes stop_codon:yes gene_type:complete
MEIIKKAWSLQLDQIEEGYMCSEETVYAETRGKAKSEMMKTDAQYLELAFDKEEITFLNVPIFRDKDNDIVKVKGQEMHRSSALFYLEQLEKRNKIELHSSNEFHRQHTREYVGNAIGFWALNGRGYTIDPEKAHVYTKEEVLQSFGKNGWDSQTYFIPVEAAKAAIRSYVESQAISQEDRI